MRRTLLLLLSLALSLALASPPVLASSDPEIAPAQEAGPPETPIPGTEEAPDSKPDPTPEEEASPSVAVDPAPHSNTPRDTPPETDAAAEPASLLASGDETGSGVSWAVYDTGELRISGNGAIYHQSALRLPWKDWQETITSVVIEPGITSVGNGCFAQHPSLERVTISDTVRSIGGEAFAMCPRLTRAVLPEGLTELGADAFRGCAALSYVLLPASLTNMGLGASFFADCPLLTSAGPAGSGCAVEYAWPDAIPDRAFQGMNALVSFAAAPGIASLGSRALSGCTSLREISLPDSLTSLGSYAFGGCTSLRKIDLPRDIAVLPEGLFTGCTALERAGLPARLEKIGNYAFQNCSKLTEISLPAGVAEIGYGAFLGTGLSSIVFEGPPPRISTAAFWRISTPGQTAYYPAGEPAWTEEYRLDYGGNITWMPDDMCGDDLHWTVREGVLTVTGAGDMWDWADAGGVPWSRRAEEIMAVYLDGEVTGVGDLAFMDCVNLTEVTLSHSLARIGINAFYNCTALERVLFTGDPPVFGEGCFAAEADKDVPELHAFFPRDSAAWSRFTPPDGTRIIRWSASAPEGSDAPLPGDVNSDGITDRADHVCLALTLAGRDAGPIDDPSADLNGDGLVDRTDRVALARLLEEQNG